MSDDRIDLGEIKRRAQAAYGGRRRPASPSEVLALVEAVEALRRIEYVWEEWSDTEGVDRCPCCGYTKEQGHDRSCSSATALARFRWEDTQDVETLDILLTWVPDAEGLRQSRAALDRLDARIEELERERGAQTDKWEQFAAEHGIPALLDHLGLDGLANEVVKLRAERDEAREALRRIADNCDAWQGQVAREALDGSPADPEPRPPADQDAQS